MLYISRSGTPGPPPPYMSQENVQDPLLEESNNNGDINGNSNLMDNNNPNRNIPDNTREENIEVVGSWGFKNGELNSYQTTY